MSTTRMLPGVRPARLEHEPGLARREGDGAGGLHRGALHRAGETVDPRRNVDRDHGPAPRAELVGEPRGVAFEGAAEAGAVHRVDRDVGAAERARQMTPVDTGRELDHVHPHAPAFERGGGNQAVATVVSLPAHDHRPVPVPTPERPPCLPRDRASGALHEDGDRRAGGDRALVGASHRVGSEHRPHGQTPTAITTAIAVASV